MGSKKVVSSFIWSFSERILAQLISFIVSIVLARLLLPEDYGLIAMVTILINIANTFVTGGFGNALVQKKDADQLDFSSVFYFNLLFSSIVYAVVFLIAPYIEVFFHQDNLSIVIRILGIRLLIAGVNSVQRAYVSRAMLFKRFFFSTIGGTIISAFVGIAMAYLGFGVWALVAQYLVNTTTDTIVLWFTVKWRPSREFSLQRLNVLLSFGWKLLLSSLLSTLYAELNELVVGKVYTSEDLAYYNKGKKFPALFVNNINAAVETVLFPSMARHQNDITLLKNDVKKAIQLSTFLIFPLVFGLAAVSDNLVSILLTDKWLPASKYMAIACISYIFVPIGMTNLQAIKAIGRSDIYLVLDIIKKAIGVSLLVFFIKKGVIAIALAESVSNAIGFMLNIFPNKKLLDYKPKEQIADFLPTLAAAIIMFYIVYIENMLPFSNIVILLIQILTGVISYISLSIILRIKAMNEVLELVKSVVKGGAL